MLYCAALSGDAPRTDACNPNSIGNMAILAAGLALFGVLILVEKRVKFPTLDLSLFKIRLFAAGNITSFLNSLAFSCGLSSGRFICN